MMLLLNQRKSWKRLLYKCFVSTDK